MRSLSIRSIFILVLVLVCSGTATSLSAQTASSSAFGAGASVSVQPAIGLQVSASVGPIPSVSGTAPPSYSNDRSVASAGLSTVLTGPILRTGVLAVHADGQTSGAPAAQSSATVNGVVLSLPLLLGLTADTVQSTAAVRVVNGVVTPSGGTILTNPQINGLLGTGLSISPTPDPNTVVLDVLGIRLVMNEQIVGNGGRSIEVNAIHLTLANVVLTGIGRISGDVTVAHSEASLDNLGAQVSVSQSASPSTVNTGGRTTYDLVINNAGPLTANVTAVTDVLPSTFTFVSSPSGTPSVNGSTVTFADPLFLPPGQSRTISIVAQAGNTTGTFTSTATVTGTNFPLATTGPSAPVTVVAPIANGSVDGTLRDAVTGAVIAGGTVTLRDGNGQVVATVVTDGSGHYSLTNLPPGSYTATFTANGYSPASVPVTIAPGAAAHVDGSLSPLPGVIQGTVRDGNSGQPVPGATVTVTYNGTTVTTTTDSSGHYQVSNVPSEVPVTVTVQHPDYGPLPPITVTLPPGGTDDRNVTLAPLPGTIGGTVVNATTNQPLAGATVRLLDANGVLVATTATDAQGHYSFANVPPGSWRLELSAAGYQPLTVSVAVAPNQSIDRTDALTPNPGTIDGTVTDASTGAPLAGATVTLTVNGSTQTATTDANGRYALTNVPPNAPATLVVSAPNYQSSTPATITLTPGSSATQDVALQPRPGTIAGTVTDAATHAALGGATIDLLRDGTVVATTSADGSGHYSLTGIGTGSYDVRFRATGYTTATLPVTVSPNQTKTLDAALSASGTAGTKGSLSGTVSDAQSGNPIGGATIELLSNGSVVATATANPAGQYAFARVEAGSYSARFSATGYNPAVLSTTIVANQTTTLDAALTASGNPATKGNLGGTIRDATSGAAIAGATAELIRNGSVVATVLANAAGQYSFDGIDAGIYSVRFSAPGYATATLATTVSAGQTQTLDASLTKTQAPVTTGTLAGSVTDAANGHAIAGAAVEIVSGGNVVATTMTDAAGHYAFANVDAGSYQVRFSASGYQPSTLSASITAGQTTTLDAALTAVAPPVTAGALGGTVSDATNGHPLSGALVELLRNGSVVASTTSGASGSYFFSNVDAGPYDVRFSAAGYQPATLSASITAGQSTTLNAALVPVTAPGTTGALTGLVTDAATAEPIGGAAVQIVRNGSVVATATADASGRYSFADVSAGDVTVRFSATGYVMLTRDTSIPAGGTQTLDAALARTAGGDTTGSVAGTITDALSGAAIAGAAVTLDEGGRTRITATDAAGRYAFANVRSAVSLQVSASADGHRPASSPSFVLAANATATINLALEPLPGAIRGTITSAPNAPLAGVTVQLVDDQGRIVATTQSDAGGHYSFPSVRPGSWTLRFTRDGYVPATELATVTSNSTVVVDARLAALGGSVSGTVRDAVTGEALPGALVLLSSNGSARTTTTNSAGEYAFAAVDANVPSTLQATHAGYADGEVVSFTLPPNGSLRRDLSLQPKRGSIGGVVSNVGGAPLAGVSVTLTSSGGSAPATATTDTAGQYLFDALLPGQYSLAFSKSGYSSATATASVLANQRTTVNQTLLAPNANGAASISGSVRDARSGAPIPGAAIALVQGGTTRTTTSDTLGNYSFDDVTAGAASTLSASKDDYLTLTTSPFTPAAGAAERHDLVLQPKRGSIGGTVSAAATHDPIANVAVELRDVAGNLLASTTTDSSGGYLFADVEAGSYRLQFRAGGYRDAFALATVAANRRSTVDVQLAAGDGSGQPADPNACANAAPILSVPAAIAVDANGRVRFYAVAADPDGVTVKARNLPACASFDASTGLFTMSGSAGCWKDSTQQIVTFDAVDSRGAKTSAPVLIINAGTALRSRRRAIGAEDSSPAIRISRPPQPVVAGVGEWVDIPIAAASDVATCAVHVDVITVATTSFDAARGILSFAPSSSDPSLADVLILATDCRGHTATSHFTLLVRRDGDAGRVAVPASDLQFGEVGAGTLSEPVTLLVRNVGGSDLEMASVQSDNPRFVVTGVNGLPVRIRPGREVAVAVRFRPTEIGPASATLTIATSDASQPLVRVHLGGLGVAQIPQPSPAGSSAPAGGVTLLVPGPQIVEHGRTLRFPVGAVAAGGSNVTVTADELPDGATFANGIFTFTPPDVCASDAPLHVVTFTAAAADGTVAAAAVSIRVVDVAPASPGRAPVISVPSDLVMVAPGSRMSLPIRALAQSTDCAVTFSMEMPAAASFDSATGMLTFAPTDADLGRIATLVVHATDCAGRTSTDAFEIATGYGSVFVRSAGLRTAQQIGIGTSPAGGALILSVMNGDDQPHVITNIGFEDGRSLLLEDGLSLPLTLAPGRTLPVRVERIGPDSVADRLVITTRDAGSAAVTTVLP